MLVAVLVVFVLGVLFDGDIDVLMDTFSVRLSDFDVGGGVLVVVSDDVRVQEGACAEVRMAYFGFCFA